MNVVEPSGMDAFITALTGTDGITASSLWGIFASLVPYLKIIIPVCLGFYLVKKLLKGTTKTKLRV